jgi:hypothetical protein
MTQRWDGTGVDAQTWEGTRRALHAVAELVLAGPQYRASGTIRLRVTGVGFATVAAPDLAVDGDILVAGDTRRPLSGRTPGALARELGLEVGAPAGLYHDGSGGRADDVLRVDLAAARALATWLAVGREALQRFAPDQTAVLWPEHFDLGVTVDEVNYGISPGDGYSPEPYAYVGPWRQPEGPFWNAPFGAVLAGSEGGQVSGLVAFFERGRAEALAGT